MVRIHQPLQHQTGQQCERRTAEPFSSLALPFGEVFTYLCDRSACTADHLPHAGPPRPQGAGTGRAGRLRRARLGSAPAAGGDERGRRLLLRFLLSVHLDRWSHGRVTLVGDAGYCAAPTSGMGTSQALIGAWALAHNPNRPRLPTTQALTGGGVVRIKDSRGELTNAATTTVLQSLGRQGRYAGCRLDHEEDARSEQDPLVMHSRLPSGRSREVRRWSS